MFLMLWLVFQELSITGQKCKLLTECLTEIKLEQRVKQHEKMNTTLFNNQMKNELKIVQIHDEYSTLSL